MPVSNRLMRRIERDFSPHEIGEIVRLVSESADAERVQAAVVLCAHGDLSRLHECVALAGLDWRDILVGAGLGNEDWRQRLDAELGADA